ncbi:MAG: CYTH domain-containing protein [Candidatus Paceibacterota bacterium]
MKRHIEVEYRARFSKDEYSRLLSILEEEGKDLGPDDKHVYFFILPDKLLKVTDNVSQNTAKITGKLTRIGEGSSFEEIEFSIAREDVAMAVLLFQKFGFTDVHRSFQSRHNFWYHGVEIALKYSDMWGYHAELEIVIGDESEKSSADLQIHNVAQELGIILMTEKELKDFVQEKELEIKSSH